MGEIAEMVLDGILCEGCGVLVDESGEGCGFPRRCEACEPPPRPPRKRRRRKRRNPQPET